MSKLNLRKEILISLKLATSFKVKIAENQERDLKAPPPPGWRTQTAIGWTPGHLQIKMAHLFLHTMVAGDDMILHLKNFKKNVPLTS